MEFNIKHGGQVFTPDYLVSNILDFAGYKGATIMRKHIIDNSCGDGAFLCQIVARYCVEFLRISTDIAALRGELETYIHGIELDSDAYNLCLVNLNHIADTFHVSGVNWDILNADTMTIDKFNRQMDYVVGNPPYVRVHNLDSSYNSVKRYLFANGGMTDLYLVFFEIGFSMLSAHGKLCYITPGSWLNSLAGGNMRSYVYQSRKMKAVIDLAHYQPFKATTYTLISLFENDGVFNRFDYYVYNDALLDKEYVDSVRYDDSYINGAFYLGTASAIQAYREMIQSPSNQYVTVKNGFATLADSVFISKTFPFEQLVIPCIKASTGKWYKAFFPYDSTGKPLPEERIFQNDNVSAYLNGHKKELLKGRSDDDCKDWYLYGRTQALKDVSTDKLAINTVIKDVDSLKINEVPNGSGLYSGLYIISSVDFHLIKNILMTTEFIEYIRLLKKYKSGGYYTFNSKELELFINYKLTQHFRIHEQSGVLTGHIEFI